MSASNRGRRPCPLCHSREWTWMAGPRDRSIVHCNRCPYRLRALINEAQSVRDSKLLVDNGGDDAHLEHSVERLCETLEEFAL